MCKGLSFFVVSNAGVLCVVMHKCSFPLKLWGGVWYNNTNNRPQVDSAIDWVNDYPAEKS